MRFKSEVLQMKIRLKTIVMVLFCSHHSIVAQPCAELAAAGQSDAIKYLNRGRDSQTALCVEHALRQIGETGSIEGIAIVLRYLDYRREPTPSEKRGATNLNTWYQYPAMIALFEIGKPAMPYLIDLLASDTNNLRRRNALETIGDIYREDPAAGVKLLSSAAEKVKGNDMRVTEAETRLTEASRELAKMCPPRVRSQCEAVLYNAPPTAKP